MEDSAERDSTRDWLLSEEAAPPLLGELVEGIQEALEVAYGSQAAVVAVGDAAIDAAEKARDAVIQSLRAAEQAHRSALLVEQASTAMLEDRGRRTAAGAAPVDDSGLRSFTERADLVVARLRALERLPA